MDTTFLEEVSNKMKALLAAYNAKEEKTFEDILNFQGQFERIHPFQEGNGRVGRLIMFKECLKYNIVSLIIEDNLKMYYFRGFKEWNNNLFPIIIRYFIDNHDYDIYIINDALFCFEEPTL